MMMLALRTSVSRWDSLFCDALDAHMRSEGVVLIDLPWESFQFLQADPNHFTARGFDTFRRCLASRVASAGVEGKVFVLSDSTVGHINREKADLPADVSLERSMARRGISASVVSQCGSGFCALRERALDFESIARRRTGVCDAHWLIIGGWNDEAQGYDLEETKAAVTNLVSLHARSARRRAL